MNGGHGDGDLKTSGFEEQAFSALETGEDRAEHSIRATTMAAVRVIGVKRQCVLGCHEIVEEGMRWRSKSKPIWDQILI